MNIRLLRRVEKHILEEPLRLDMDCWLSHVPISGQYMPACGTVGCIYGWAKVLSSKLPPQDVVIPTYAQSDMALLGLNSDQAGRLFLKERWPDKFKKKAFRYKAGGMAAAKNTVARIEHFIATKGQE